MSESHGTNALNLEFNSFTLPLHISQIFIFLSMVLQLQTTFTEFINIYEKPSPTIMKSYLKLINFSFITVKSDEISTDIKMREVSSE